MRFNGETGENIVLKETQGMKWRWNASLDQKGAALIMALFLLVILTFVGLNAILTSSSELILSSYFKRSKEAFLAAEGATEYVMKEPRLLAGPPGIPGQSFVDFPLTGVNLDVVHPDPGNNAIISSAKGRVTYLGRKAPPVDSGMSITRFKGDYFNIDATGTGTLNSRSRHRVVISSIVPGGS